jgi:hypothetical protein
MPVNKLLRGLYARIAATNVWSAIQSFSAGMNATSPNSSSTAGRFDALGAPSGVPAFPTDTSLVARGKNGGNNIIPIYAYGGLNHLVGYRWNGTYETPTDIVAGDELMRFGCRGRVNGANSATRAQISFLAAENWTSTAQGAYQAFFVTPIGTTTLLRAFAIQADRCVVFDNGINFGSTYFKNYEEGTFTPSLYFGLGNTGVVYAQRRAVYTRIGNTVRVEIVIQLSSKGSSTGAITIGGLPFTTNPSYFGGGSASYWETAGTIASIHAYCDPNSTVIRLLKNGNAALTDADFTNTSYLILTFTYQV